MRRDCDKRHRDDHVRFSEIRRDNETTRKHDDVTRRDKTARQQWAVAPGSKAVGQGSEVPAVRHDVSVSPA